MSCYGTKNILVIKAAKKQKVGGGECFRMRGGIPCVVESDIIGFGHEINVCSAVVVSEWLLLVKFIVRIYKLCSSVVACLI
jgi:hypothetical protein